MRNYVYFCIHEKIKSSKCDPCGKSFSRMSTLTKHVKVVHDNIKAYKCDSCDRSFGASTHLNLHVKNVHENLKEFYYVLERLLHVVASSM